MRRDADPSAFSLVEVTLALGIVAFAIVIVVALLPAGLKLSGESSDELVATNILSALATDVRDQSGNSPFFRIPLGYPNKGTNYFREDGKDLGASLTDEAVYQVSWNVRERDPHRGLPRRILFQVTWPAGKPTRNGCAEATVVLMENVSANS